MVETAVIDRIEENFAVCELTNKSTINVPLNKFNFDISESDVVKLNLKYENGKVSEISVISKDTQEKILRQNLINNKFNSLKK